MPVQESTFFTQRCSAAIAPMDPQADFCRAKIEYLLHKIPKERCVRLNYLFSFPIVEKKKEGCFAQSLHILKVLKREYDFPEIATFRMRINTRTFELFDEREILSENPIVYKTKDLMCACPIRDFADNPRNVFALRIRPQNGICGFIHYFSICEPNVASTFLCEKINNIIENAEDTFIVERLTECDFTIDYKILKSHVDVLNNIIKEVIDMAIVVARSIEARKRIEKNPKAINAKKGKELSMKMMANSPTSDEYVCILEKVRLALNIMARLNPFVNNPNVPELLHHMLAPFSLITAVCGLDIVRSVEKPYLTQKAIWLIEHCLTTTELAYWRTLGESWNRPKCSYPIEDVFEHYYETDPELVLASPCNGKYSDTDCHDHSFQCPYLAIVLCHHFKSRDEEINAAPGTVVQVYEKEGDFDLVSDSSGCSGLIPKNKLYPLRGICCDDWLYATYRQCMDQHMCEINYQEVVSAENPSSVETESKSTSCSKSSKSMTSSTSTYNEVSKKPNDVSQHTKTTSHTTGSSKLVGTSSHHSGSLSCTPEIQKSQSHTKIESFSSKSYSKSKSSKSDTTQESVPQQEIIEASYHSSKCSQKLDSQSHVTVSSGKKKEKKRICWCCTKKPKVKKDVICSVDESKTSPSVTPVKSQSSLSSKSSKSSSKVVSRKTKTSSSSFSPSSSNVKSGERSRTKIPMVDSSISSSSTCPQQQVKVEPPTQVLIEQGKYFQSEQCPKGISLCWSKSQSPQEDCIKIEGIKLFRVRIKLMPCEDEENDGTSALGKATLLLKSPDEISLKPNSKLVAQNAQELILKTPIKKSGSSNVSLSKRSDPSLKLKRVVCTTDSSIMSTSESSKPHYQSKHEQEVSQAKIIHSPQKSVSTCTDKGISICCEEHLYRSLDKTESLKRAPVTVSPSEVPYRETEKDELSKEVWCEDETCVEKTNYDSFMNTKEVYRILTKYIAPKDLPKSIIGENVEEDRKVSHEALVDFCKKNICKDCGGICSYEKVYVPEHNKIYYQQVCTSVHQPEEEVIAAKPSSQSDESSKPKMSPPSSTLTTSCDEKTSTQMEIPSFKDYCNLPLYHSGDKAFSPLNSNEPGPKIHRIISPNHQSQSDEKSESSSVPDNKLSQTQAKISVASLSKEKEVRLEASEKLISIKIETSEKSPSPKPASPKSVSPKPTSPAPASPTSASPTPASPTPATPTPSSPQPTTPTPASPTPASPTPASPTPASPTPASPTPASPTPISPKSEAVDNKPVVVAVEAKPIVDITPDSSITTLETPSTSRTTESTAPTTTDALSATEAPSTTEPPSATEPTSTIEEPKTEPEAPEPTISLSISSEKPPAPENLTDKVATVEVTISGSSDVSSTTIETDTTPQPTQPESTITVETTFTATENLGETNLGNTTSIINANETVPVEPTSS